MKYKGEINSNKIIKYYKKIKLLNYFANITYLDIVKTALKLAEFLINLAPEYKKAADYYL